MRQVMHDLKQRVGTAEYIQWAQCCYCNVPREPTSDISGDATNARCHQQ